MFRSVCNQQSSFQSQIIRAALRRAARLCEDGERMENMNKNTPLVCFRRQFCSQCLLGEEGNRWLAGEAEVLLHWLSPRAAGLSPQEYLRADCTGECDPLCPSRCLLSSYCLLSVFAFIHLLPDALRTKQPTLRVWINFLQSLLVDRLNGGLISPFIQKLISGTKVFSGLPISKSIYKNESKRTNLLQSWQHETMSYTSVLVELSIPRVGMHWSWCFF